jgi:hydrogenase-4 component F
VLGLALIVVPLACGALAFATQSNRWRPWWLPVGAAAHLALTIAALDDPAAVTLGNRILFLDPLGKLFLAFVSVLFLGCALYAPAYFRQRPERSNRVLCATMLSSLAMMSLVFVSHHLGLMWVAIEATTLFSAPSIYFNHNRRSLEATWKYLVICSVGIALALFGSLFLAYSAFYSGQSSSLLFDDLAREAPHLSLPWLHAAFVLLFVGYGTKMGLAPMHTWKPDAYGEAPGLIGALLAGGVTSVGFLAIVRIFQIAQAAGDAEYARRILIVVGLLSMGLAAVSMARQKDLKRLLAYSSVEHMGMLVVGIGVGGAAMFGSLLHLIHNGMTKGVLFLAAGNIHRAYGSKMIADLKGTLQRMPFSGWMLLIGFFAITGSPPFAPFVSEFQIVVGCFGRGYDLVGSLFLLFMLIMFIGFGIHVLSISFGDPPEEQSPSGFHDTLGTSLPILYFLAITLILGVFNPPFVERLVRDAGQFLEKTPEAASSMDRIDPGALHEADEFTVGLLDLETDELKLISVPA